MTKPIHTAQWQHALVMLSYTVVGALVVAGLYWAQVVFIPLALAMLFTLVLTPPVMLLQRMHLGRIPAVILVVALSGGLLFGMGWLVARQFVGLAAELPQYSDAIKTKVRDLKQLAGGTTSGRMGKLVEDISRELQGEPPTPKKTEAKPAEYDKAAKQVVDDLPPKNPEGPPATTEEPVPVVMQPESTDWLGRATSAIGSIGESAASIALALVLTIFMLLNRENLRDRLIRLIGHGRLTATTKAFDEAVHRISRFLLMQLVVNSTYGIALSLGLLILGVPYSLFWGLLAAVLRYIPYLGAWIAAIPPVLISFVMSEGWTQPMLVVAWIVLIELVSNNVVEPKLYGHSIGVSEVALLVAAAFWAFLWGPIGLVLSSPLTVCLVVLGKYVPALEFLDILLGDKPALQPHETFYQRLLARDKDEAARVATTQAKAISPRQVYDALIVPALSYFKRDCDHNELSEADQQFIVAAIREIVDELGLLIAAETPPAAVEDAPAELPAPRHAELLIVPADGEPDAIAVQMLRHLLPANRWDVHAAGDDVLAAELVESVVQQHVPVVCIASLPPGGITHTRYLCKRLRTGRSELKIVVGRWTGHTDTQAHEDSLRAAGADDVEETLLDTCQVLDSWWNVLATAPDAGPGEPAVARPHFVSATSA